MNTQNQTVLILDFGGQYSHLIARRVRELRVYCEVYPSGRVLAAIEATKPVGIILTGGPNSVYEPGAPLIPAEVFERGIPVLGICYGAQLMAHVLGGRAAATGQREYGQTETRFDPDSPLFAGLPETGVTWMSHGVSIQGLPTGFRGAASTQSTSYAAIENPQKKLYGLQFHPEVSHTQNGLEMLRRFLYDICPCVGDWHMGDYAERTVAEMRAKIGDGKVLLALSGGVDSSVCAALLSKAVGRQLTCIFVDHGLLRKDEGDEVEAAFRDWDIRLIRVNAEARFLARLSGQTEPEAKRKIIGEEFIRVFEEEAKKIGSVDFLAQGTIYPDVIESGAGNAAVIKSHHNTGGLPDHVDFKEIVEPLRLLFKDEVRRLGVALGLDDSLVWRQPFPGPGLAIRVIGDLTAEKLDMLREADAIFRAELALAGLDRDIHQYFAVLTSLRSVGVMGDERTYDYTLALRGVTTTDFMTADFARIPYDVLARASGRIVGEVPHINRIVYDITSKPPATIEWE
ncbi:MAG: glutamine-hydrolyzing GMP synthase [Oscillospiraceae bacterium]|nr:glutamine-hydrolyzing GMP synthase [Oscillospiraceae bacterium]